MDATATSPAQRVFYSDQHAVIIDFVREVDGELRTEMFQKTIEDARQRYPDVEVLGFDEAIERKERRSISEPVEIDFARFNEALCALPPERWKSVDGVESFMMAERLTGRVATFYAHLVSADRYFTFNDIAPMKNEEIAVRIKQFADEQPAASAAPSAS